MEINRTHELRNRILFTVFMLAVYFLGKGIVLYGVSAGGGTHAGLNPQILMTMMFSGDRYQTSIMALGVVPYINASLLVQIVAGFRSSDARARISKQRMDRWMLSVTVVIAAVMAVVQSADLQYRESAGNLWLVRIVVILEMFGGAMLTYFLCAENEKRGIGASMPIILVNIIISLEASLNAHHFFRYRNLLLLCAAVILLTVYMESAIVKVPLQRVSIHNIHADQNYIAYKRNPVGIMPVMFASAVLILPRYFFRILAYLFPESPSLASIRRNLVLTRPLGSAVYLFIIVILALVFSFIMLNPRESARQLQRNGDSIIGVYAGRKTTRYLVSLVFRLSLISGLLQAACMAVSLFLSLHHEIPAPLAMAPSAMMILVSILCSLIQEISTYYHYDAYRFFI